MTTVTAHYQSWKRRSVLRIALLLGFSLVGIPLALAWFPLGVVIYLGVIIALSVEIFGWHRRNTDFHCSHCRTDFSIPTPTFLSSVNWGLRKFLRCPNCERSHWCHGVPRRTSSAAQK